MMRILVIHNDYRSSEGISGETQVVERDIAALREVGHEVSVLEWHSDEIAQMPIHKRAMVPLRVVWSRPAFRAASQAIATFRPDVVHVHNTFPLLSPSVVMAAQTSRVPVVVTLHNYRLTCANGLLLRDGVPCTKCVERSSLAAVKYGCYRDSKVASVPMAALIGTHRLLKTWHHADALIVLSQFAKGILTQSGLPAERIRVRPNWSAGPKTRRSGPGDYFAYLGRFSPEKGITKLLDAWGDMNHSLVIAGSGQLAPAVVEAAGSSRRIEYRGQLARSDCDELLAGARALIVPSRCYEGFPLVVAEAMAAGVPVIGPNHGPFPEIITHGETGHLFDGTVEGLRSAVSSLASDSTSTRMGIAARRDFEERFSKEAGVAGLEAIYQEVVARPGQIESEAPLELGLQRTGGM